MAWIIVSCWAIAVFAVSTVYTVILVRRYEAEIAKLKGEAGGLLRDASAGESWISAEPDSPLERLRKQILAAEEHLRSLQSLYPASHGSLSWMKDDNGAWRIFLRGRPLLQASASERIAAVDDIPSLRAAIIEARKDALSDAGMAAARLSEMLKNWNCQPK